MENTNVVEVTQVKDEAVVTATTQTNEKEAKEPREFKEERFDFELYVNDNLICKRNFKINNFIFNSMQSLDFKDAVDEIVYMLDCEMKSKSRIYMWYNYMPDEPESEFNEDLLEPWACTFKLVILDKKRPVITKIWDGYGYPRAIRQMVDFTNKIVKFTSKSGKTYVFDKDTYFAERGDMLTHEMYVLKQILENREDMLLNITRKICEVCSPREGMYQTTEDYALQEELNDGTVYSLTMDDINKKVEEAWEEATKAKTQAYMKQFAYKTKGGKN